MSSTGCAAGGVGVASSTIAPVPAPALASGPGDGSGSSGPSTLSVDHVMALPAVPASTKWKDIPWQDVLEGKVSCHRVMMRSGAGSLAASATSAFSRCPCVRVSLCPCVLVCVRPRAQGSPAAARWRPHVRNLLRPVHSGTVWQAQASPATVMLGHQVARFEQRLRHGVRQGSIPVHSWRFWAAA